MRLYYNQIPVQKGVGEENNVFNLITLQYIFEMTFYNILRTLETMYASSQIYIFI